MSGNPESEYTTVDDAQAEGDELISKITRAIMGDKIAGVSPMVLRLAGTDEKECNEALEKVATILAKQLEEKDLTSEQLQTKIRESSVNIAAQLNAMNNGIPNFSIALRATVAAAPTYEKMQTPQGDGVRALVNRGLAASATKTGDSGSSLPQEAPAGGPTELRA